MLCDICPFRFFNDLFPFVFHSALFNGSSVTVSADCPLSSQVEGNPSPLGTIPVILGKAISSLVYTAKLLVNNLADGSKLFENVMQWLPTDRCRDLLTKLISCPACHDYDTTKPCRAFCTDVMDTCLTEAGNIDDLWNQFIDRIIQINKQMLVNDFEAAMASIHWNISLAILHSLESVYQQNQEVCIFSVMLSACLPALIAILTLILQILFFYAMCNNFQCVFLNV